MIIKISKPLMTGAVIKDQQHPEGFSFFPAFDAGKNTFCYVTDGMSNEIAVSFQVVGLPDTAINNMRRMVGLSILQQYGLPEGQP